MKAELIPLNGAPPIPITRDVTVVGRREFCDVLVEHPSLSKRHCVLVRTDGLLVVRDLVSTNGTKVNGQRVLWAALLPNDRLTLGRAKFKVYLGPDDAPAPSETWNRGQSVRGGDAPGLAAVAAVGFAAPSPSPDKPVFVPNAPPPPAAPADDDLGGLEILDDDEPYVMQPDDEPYVMQLDAEDDDEPEIIDLDD
jgi:predicted component of type VI protein secretion system